MNCKIFSGTFWLFVFYQEPGTDILRTKRQKSKVPLISSATVFKICKRNSSSNSQASFGLPTISRKVEIIFMVQSAFSWMRAACKLFAKTFISQPCSVCSNPYKGAQEKWADIMPLTSIRDWNFYVPFSGFFWLFLLFPSSMVSFTTMKNDWNFSTLLSRENVRNVVGARSAGVMIWTFTCIAFQKFWRRFRLLLGSLLDLKRHGMEQK